MKNIKLWALIFFTCQVLALGAQINAIPYQTIISDQNGDVLKLVTMELNVNVIQDSPGGSIMYTEEHQVTTGVRGEIQLEIGQGNPTLLTFDNIDWEKPNYIEVLIKPEGVTNFLSIGKTEMLSVPYALFAIKLGCDSGCPGENGKQGQRGIRGVQGERGLQGAQGIGGLAGRDGIDGLAGIFTLDVTDQIPNNPATGQFYLDNGSNRPDGKPGFRYFDGTNWINL